MAGCRHGVAPVLPNQTPDDANLVDDSKGAHRAHSYSLSTCGWITRYADEAGVYFTWFSDKPRPLEDRSFKKRWAGIRGDEKKIRLRRTWEVPQRCQRGWGKTGAANPFMGPARLVVA